MRRSGGPSDDRVRARTARPAVAFELNAPFLNPLLGSSTGVAPAQRVSRSEAVSVPAVKRGRDLICGTLGALPIKLHDTTRKIIPSELFEQPENDVARSVTMTMTVEDMFFEGRAWWRILEFDGFGYPIKVRRLDARTVNVHQDQKVYARPDGSSQGAAMEWIPDELLIRIDSPNDPLLVAGARAIRMALLLDRRAERYVEDPLPLGYFSPAEGQEDQDPSEVQGVLDEWEAARNERTWGYLGKALKANILQWDPEKLQLSSSRDHAVLELSRLMGIDPEDLGVSTTSRTYANSESRRLDLIDFTLNAYAVAIEDRLKMPDVVWPGHRPLFKYEGFLRSDTETRMRTYKLGREVGVYNSERIAEIEVIPDATPQPVPQAERTPTAAATASEPPVSLTDYRRANGAPQARFSGDDDGVHRITFASDQISVPFAVDVPKRTITGLAVPWNKIARSGWARWKFAPNSLFWSDVARVKMLRDHDFSQAVGVATALQNGVDGLVATFKIARGDEGDKVLSLADDGVLDGLSIGVWFDGEADEWQPDPTEETVRLVRRGTLREISITALPSFDDARITSVTASADQAPNLSGTAPATPEPEKGPTMTGPTAPAPPANSDGSAPADVQATTAAAVDAALAQFTAGITPALATAVAEAFAQLPFPQQDTPPGRQVVPAGRVTVTAEAPVYLMNGSGPSLVRDSWHAARGDTDARDRLRKFEAQTADMAEKAAHAMFAANTSNAASIIPPGYRPDLYVTQLLKGRPLTNGLSHGVLTDATPFTIPKFVSSTGLTAVHVEGTNPTDGTIVLDTVTVTPKAVSGLFRVTREIVDSSNPAIDAIATNAMGESYSQQTEAYVYAELNGVNGQGGTITAGFVPSGAQVTTSVSASGLSGGAELLDAIRELEALYAFRRFAAPDRGYLSQEATTQLARAKGTDGRPLLPSVGGQNVVGSGNAVQRGWDIDGLVFEPCWSMTGNAAGDSDVLMIKTTDAWVWESGLLTFRYEERSGPAYIDLALFAYHATRLIRPVGLASDRHTQTP